MSVGVNFIFSALLLLILAGCNSMFYYPDNVNYLLPQDKGPTCSDCFLVTADNHRIHVWVLEPSTKPHGVIIHFHGNARNLTNHVGHVRWLTNHGYFVVTFDYRGYGRSDGKPSREGLILDGQTVLRHFARQFDSYPIFVIGQSLGGAVAIPVLALTPEVRPRALIVDSTFDSYRRIFRSKLGSFFLTWPLQWPCSVLVSNDYSPDEWVEKLTLPILFIHGDADATVPMEFGERLFQKARSPKEFWKISGARHTSALSSDVYRQRLIAFLQARLSGS